MTDKPSERFCKHGFLTQGERYHPDLHNSGENIEERCAKFYTQEEIARMKDEMKVAECAICMINLSDNDCRVCSDGHKFHRDCLIQYWATNPIKRNWCPITNSIPTGGWQNCGNIHDIHSGGRRRKKRKKTNRKKKSNKKKYNKTYSKKSRNLKKTT